MSRQGYEFGFWAILVVGAGVAVIMWQHAVHTSIILNAMPMGGASPNTGNATLATPSTLAAVDTMAGTPPNAIVPPSGFAVFTPTGPDEMTSPFTYQPGQRFQ